MAGKKRTKKGTKTAGQAGSAPGAPTLPTDLEQEITKAAAAAEDALEMSREKSTQPKKPANGKKKTSKSVTVKADKTEPDAPEQVGSKKTAKPTTNKGKNSAPVSNEEKVAEPDVAAGAIVGTAPPPKSEAEATASDKTAGKTDATEQKHDSPDTPADTPGDKTESSGPDADEPASLAAIMSQEETAGPGTSDTGAGKPAIGKLSVPASGTAADTRPNIDPPKDAAPNSGTVPAPNDADTDADSPKPVTYENAVQAGVARPGAVSEPNVDIEDDQIDDAVEDIVRAEGDALLEAQDKVAGTQRESRKQKDKKSRSPRSWKKWLVWFIVVAVLAAVIAAAVIPAARYTILNALGVRVSASVTVVDDTTRQPLRNVSVQIGDVSAETDEEGNATLRDLQLGAQALTIERIAFAAVEEEVTLGWGSNPLGTFRLTAAGVQYTFVLRDQLSAQPIEGAEVSSGQFSALSDDEGNAILTIEETDAEEIAVTISASGYRTDELSLQVETADEVLVTMVPDRKAVFVARGDNGRYNVYGTYVDGTDRTVLLPGTGNEDSRITLAVSPDATRAAVVSTRESIRAEDGTLLQSLSLVSTNSGNSQTLERALDIRLIDWIGTTLVYRITMPGVAEDSAERQRLMGYDYKKDERTQLATANEFASIASAQGAVYYSAAVASGEDGELMRVSPDGANARLVLGRAVQRAHRTDYGTLTLQASDGWYELVLGQDTASETSAPASTNSRMYIMNDSATRSLWIDGETLMAYHVPADENTRLDAQAGLGYPVYWLTNTAAVYRVADTDYVKSLAGEAPHRIANVIPTTGLIQAY